jgi:hypothetical protein
MEELPRMTDDLLKQGKSRTDHLENVAWLVRTPDFSM